MFADLLAWLDQTGPWSPEALFLVFVGLNLVGIPATLLSSVTGFFLSPLVAVPLALVARSIAALTSWFVGRRLLGERVRLALARRPRLSAFHRAIGDGGMRSVVLVRLAPTLPSTITSFAFGLTRVRPGALFLGTLVGTIPNTVIAVLIGDSLDDLARMDEARADWNLALRILLIVGLAALALFLRGVIRRARSGDPT